MTTHRTLVKWDAASKDFTYKTYNRRHHWIVDGGQEISVSAAPQYFGDADCLDPEEAFIGALSSCHLLTFLMIACKRGFQITSYVDDAAGEIGKSPSGAMAITKVTLSPDIVFEGKTPDTSELSAMHEQAHQQCFIANSVNTQIIIASD